MTHWDERASGPPLIVAIVVYQGVLADETQAFREALGLIPDARVHIIGARLGVVAGPGGAQQIDVTFDELTKADVVVVPGGLGAHRHPEISAWLRRIKPRFILASSTGSALLAAGGLLRGRTAVTHWLAGPLLEQHGVTVSTQRLVVDEPFVTCSGLASAFDAAFVVARAVGGPMLVRRIREQLRDQQPMPEPVVSPPPARVERPQRPPPRRPATISVEVELEERPPPR